jgi:hypothetical protein
MVSAIRIRSERALTNRKKSRANSEVIILRGVSERAGLKVPSKELEDRILSPRPIVKLVIKIKYGLGLHVKGYVTVSI